MVTVQAPDDVPVVEAAEPVVDVPLGGGVGVPDVAAEELALDEDEAADAADAVVGDGADDEEHEGTTSWIERGDTLRTM